MAAETKDKGISPERSLAAGAEKFNARAYQTAHEDWEIVWRSAVDPEKTHLKAMIQVCGMFHLIGVGRFDPALRLAERAIELFAEAEAHFQLHARQPRLVIPGVEDVVLRIAASLKCGMVDATWFLELGRGLKASVATPSNTTDPTKTPAASVTGSRAEKGTEGSIWRT